MKNELLYVLKQKYIELMLESNNLTFSEKQLYEKQIIKKLQVKHLEDIEIEDTRKIYMCLGKNYWGLKNKSGNYFLDANYMMPTPGVIACAYYKNIEKPSDSHVVPLDKCDDFEKKHDIIYGNIDLYQIAFYNYWKTSIKENQETAINIIKQKHK